MFSDDMYDLILIIIYCGGEKKTKLKVSQKLTKGFLPFALEPNFRREAAQARPLTEDG